MAGMFGKGAPVRGVRAPRRRFTGWAALYFLAFVCVPVLGLAAILDVALYFVFTEWFESCYALLCLWE